MVTCKWHYGGGTGAGRLRAGTDCAHHTHYANCTRYASYPNHTDHTCYDNTNHPGRCRPGDGESNAEKA